MVRFLNGHFLNGRFTFFKWCVTKRLSKHNFDILSYPFTSCRQNIQIVLLKSLFHMCFVKYVGAIESCSKCHYLHMWRTYWNLSWSWLPKAWLWWNSQFDDQWSSHKSAANGWEGEIGWGCWRYRGPIGRDDTREWPVWAWYRSWPYRRKFGSRKFMKNRVKWRILLVWTLHRPFWAKPSGNCRILYIEFDSELKQIGSQVEKIMLKEFAGKFGTYFFHIFQPYADTK